MDTLADLQERMLATPDNATILTYFVTSATKIMRDGGAPSVDALVATLTIPKLPFSPAPMSTFLVFMETLSQAMGPDEAFTAVAKHSLRRFFGSPPGVIIKALARTGPHSLLASATIGYKACVNFGERKYVYVGKREAIMTFKEDYFGPAWHAAGIFPLAFKIVCRVDTECTVEDKENYGMDFVVRVRW